MSELLKREKMARALFEVGAPPHQFWDDVGLDRRELYLCMADAALSQGSGDPAPPAPTPVSADKDRWAVQGFDPEERGVAIIEERAGIPPGGTPTNGIQVWVPLWPSEWEDDDRAAYPDRALRVAARICDAVNAAPPVRAAAMIGEPDVKCDRCGSVGDTYRLCAGCGAPTTSPEPLNSRATAASPEPDAVREALSKLVKAINRYDERPDSDVALSIYMKAKDDAIAALSRPAHGGWEDIIEQCAKVCDELRHQDYSAESVDWREGTTDCATAIRALARNDRQSGGPQS